MPPYPFTICLKCSVLFFSLCGNIFQNFMLITELITWMLSTATFNLCSLLLIRKIVPLRAEFEHQVRECMQKCFSNLAMYHYYLNESAFFSELVDQNESEGPVIQGKLSRVKHGNIPAYAVNQITLILWPHVPMCT